MITIRQETLMLMKEAIRTPETNLESHELVKLIETLNGDDRRIAENALLQIRRMQDELQAEKGRFHEVTSFFQSWTEGFEDILKTPVNMDNHEQLQIRYPALRNSAKNLIDSCRKKISEFDFSAGRK